jgi:hypothetical protein
MRQTKLFDNISHTSLVFCSKYSCVCVLEIFKISQRKKYSYLISRTRDKGNPAQACSTLSSIGVVFMVLNKEPENVHVSQRCMYVPLISEITLENFLFG